MTRLAVVVLMLCALGACGSDRPDIDPTPYRQQCTKAPDTCPMPYQCTTQDVYSTGPVPDECYLACPHGDNDCPTGFVCNGGAHSVADLGPPRGFCFNKNEL